jgi:predicted nuclease with TOPRIM domain
MDLDKDGFLSEIDLQTCLDNLQSDAFFKNCGEALASSSFSSQKKFFPDKDALNPENKALKQQNSQIIQELEKSNANLEAYKNEIDRLNARLKAFKGEVKDIRELIGANDDESAFDEVQRLHNKNISTYIAFAGFFEKTIDLIPNDLAVEVQKTLNELKPCNSKS